MITLIEYYSTHATHIVGTHFCGYSTHGHSRLYDKKSDSVVVSKNIDFNQEDSFTAENLDLLVRSFHQTVDLFFIS